MRKLVEIIEIGSIKLQGVIVGFDNECKGCYCKRDKLLCGDKKAQCLTENRDDGNNIIWEKINEK